mgnify:CR=1 FL=1|jgi:hypothetical protein
MLFKMILREECNVGARLLGWCTSCSGKRQSRAETSAPLGEHQSRTSHRFHRCAQIRRVWHPAIPTQPLNYLPTEATEPYAA